MALESTHFRSGQPHAPRSWDEVVGREAIVLRLQTLLRLASDGHIEHLLFAGSLGTGRATVAQVLAREIGVGFHHRSASDFASPGDWAGIMTTLERGDVLFIEQIHQLGTEVQKLMLTAMREFGVDAQLQSDARTIPLNFAPFSVIGSTDHPSSLSASMLDAFQVRFQFGQFTDQEVVTILERQGIAWSLELDRAGLLRISQHAKGRPAEGLRLLDWAANFDRSRKGQRLDETATLKALWLLGYEEDSQIPLTATTPSTT